MRYCALIRFRPTNLVVVVVWRGRRQWVVVELGVVEEEAVVEAQPGGRDEVRRRRYRGGRSADNFENNELTP